MQDRERMLCQKLYDPYHSEKRPWSLSRELLEAFNTLPYAQKNRRLPLLRELLGTVHEDTVITPPFYCDKGYNIHIGPHFYANTDLLILDEASVTFGSHCFLGPRISIYTACHPIDAEVRRTELEYALPVSIGDDVWIGGNVVINPGVHIGSGTVIGSGSVVTRDIPAGVIAAGNPCRVLRVIDEADHRYWKEQEAEYRKDPDTGQQPDESISL